LVGITGIHKGQQDQSQRSKS